MTIYSSLTYLEKQRFLPRQIEGPVPTGLRMVVVIPCFAETQLLRTLDSLEACDEPDSPVEVLIVVNQGLHHGNDIRDLNQDTIQAFEAWNHQRRNVYHLIQAMDLPRKHAGVGLARKIGMDEAVDRLEQADAQDGLIINLDADSLVQSNYLVELEALSADRKHDAWSIHFEHPLTGEEYSPQVYDGIVLYELFLRYYMEGLRFAGYPMAFHTIGSSMVVRSRAYQAQGGMNRRKAGEDFYFLHKFSQLGTLGECNRTLVIPSPRPSAKVPFGTGKAILSYLDRPEGNWDIYPPSVFEALKELVQTVPAFQAGWPKLSDPVRKFLEEEQLPERLPDIRRHARSQQSFLSRFYAWLDPLKVLRMIHFLRDQHLGEIDLVDAALTLGRMNGLILCKDPVELLTWYREHQTGRG